jgi:hypothetical protein
MKNIMLGAYEYEDPKVRLEACCSRSRLVELATGWTTEGSEVESR